MEEKTKKNLLKPDGYYEWYGALYVCPFCGGVTIWSDFKFCPLCGKNLNHYSFGDRYKEVV